MESNRSPTAEAFKALGDPVRWTIVRQMAEQPELPGAALDEQLSISRPTISYHIRILVQAGLVDVSKRGRMHYYTLRHDMLRSLIGELTTLMPDLPAADERGARADAPAMGNVLSAPLKHAAVLPTW